MTGNYPRGKLNDEDEGTIMVKVDIQDNTLIVDFGKDITWFGMDKQRAIEFGKMLIEKAHSMGDLSDA